MAFGDCERTYAEQSSVMSHRFALAAMVVFACLNPTTGVYATEAPKAGAVRLDVCHGFGCHFKSELDLGGANGERLSAIMTAGAASAIAERAAISKAVRFYEDRAARVVGVRDQPKSDASQFGKRGQMDCIDESSNTRSLLVYLERRGLLKHHRVARNVTRGFLIDRRYPHSAAVLREKSGKKWVVDSWYESAGGPPDIMPLSEWTTRGVMGAR